MPNMARSSDPDLARRVATHVVRVLRDAGHTAYLAGGCVRDALLGLNPTDFDVATDAVPQRVRALFPRTQEVGESFGVVLVPIRASELAPHRAGASPAHPASHDHNPKAIVEVATFRSDGPYHDARRPEHVTFSDPESDAQRRDFTINALFLDPLAPPDPALPLAGGRIIDYVGGVADLRSKVLRAVGDPDKRLQEDHLRALRAVRFSARLGFALEDSTAQAITRHAAALTGVSRERVGDELRRMLSHPAAPAALELLQRLGLDAPVLADVNANPPLPLVRALGPDQHPMTVLGAWLLDRAGAALSRPPTPADLKPRLAKVRSSLCLSNDESDHLTGALMTAHDLAAWPSLSVAARKRLAFRPFFPAAISIDQAGHPQNAAKVIADLHVLQSDGIGIHPVPLITGDDLVSQGFTPGPAFRRALDETYDAQLEGRIRDKLAALELARRLCV